jgi:hypothetical protein
VGFTRHGGEDQRCEDGSGGNWDSVEAVKERIGRAIRIRVLDESEVEAERIECLDCAADGADIAAMECMQDCGVRGRRHEAAGKGAERERHLRYDTVTKGGGEADTEEREGLAGKGTGEEKTRDKD